MHFTSAFLISCIVILALCTMKDVRSYDQILVVFLILHKSVC